MPDQEPVESGGRFASFFGLPALTMTLVPRLLRRTGASAVFGYALREDRGGFTMHFEEASPELADEDLDRALAALNRGVERCVRAAPEQYQTPIAGPGRTFMPRVGEGHQLTGIWPPLDIPRYIWDVLDLFYDVEDYHTFPEPGGSLDQCTWTMGAFSILRSTRGEIREAQAAFDDWKRRQK